jgi:hypothetical protein
MSNLPRLVDAHDEAAAKPPEQPGKSLMIYQRNDNVTFHDPDNSQAWIKSDFSVPVGGVNQ